MIRQALSEAQLQMLPAAVPSEFVLLNPMTQAPTELDSLAPTEERSPGNNPGRIPRNLEVRSASGRFDFFTSVQ